VLTAGLTAALVALLPGASAAPVPGAAAAPVAGDGQSSSPALVVGRLSVHRADPDLLALPVLQGVALEEAASAAAAPGTAAPRSPDAAGFPLAAGGVPTTAMAAYSRAAELADCGISWTLIAAIGRVESNHGRFAGAVLSTDGLSTPPIIGIPLTGNGTARILDSDGGRFDGDTVHDRAVGPMQFIPTTWALHGADGNGDGRRDPFNINDAALATGNYLCAAGGDLTSGAGRARAVFAYNHSDEYVATVLGLAATYAGTPPPSPVPTTAGPVPTVPPADPARPPAIGRVVEPPRPSDDQVLAAAESPAVPLTPSPPPPAAPAVQPPTSAAAPTPAVPTPVAPTSETPEPAAPTPLASTTEEPAPTTAEPAPATEPVPTTAPPAPATEPVPTTAPPASTTEPVPTTTTTTTTTAPPPATSTPPGTPPTIAPPVTSAPPVDACEPAAATTVDVHDGTGDPALAEEVAQRLRDSGLTVGTVTAGEAATSGIEFAEADRERAERLAAVLGEVELLRAGTGEHVTLVLGADDSAALVEAVRAFTGLPC